MNSLKNNRNNRNNRNNQDGGDGYSVNPASSIGGQAEIDRYSYSDLVLPTCTATATRQSGGFGQMLFSNFVAELNNLLAPLGLNALSSLVVLLGLKLLADKRKAKSQKGGSMAGLTSVLLPMGKENLVTLASLLLIQYFLSEKSISKKIKSIGKRRRSGRKSQKGGFGSAFMGELNTLLAPLGLNALGTSIILLFLTDILSKKSSSGSGKTSKRRRSRLMKGGSIISQFTNILAPSGVEMFTISAVLMILQRIFSNAASRSSKGQRGGYLFAGLLNELNQLLMPLGAVPFATTLSLLVLYNLYNRPSSSSSELLKGTYGVGKKLVKGTYGVGKKLVKGTYGVGKSAVTGTYGVGKKLVKGTYGVGKKAVKGTYSMGKKLIKRTKRTKRTTKRRSYSKAK